VGWRRGRRGPGAIAEVPAQPDGRPGAGGQRGREVGGVAEADRAPRFVGRRDRGGPCGGWRGVVDGHLGRHEPGPADEGGGPRPVAVHAGLGRSPELGADRAQDGDGGVAAAERGAHVLDDAAALAGCQVPQGELPLHPLRAVAVPGREGRPRQARSAGAAGAEEDRGQQVAVVGAAVEHASRGSHAAARGRGVREGAARRRVGGADEGRGRGDVAIQGEERVGAGAEAVAAGGRRGAGARLAIGAERAAEVDVAQRRWPRVGELQLRPRGVRVPGGGHGGGQAQRKEPVRRPVEARRDQVRHARRLGAAGARVRVADPAHESGLERAVAGRAVVLDEGESDALGREHLAVHAGGHVVAQLEGRPVLVARVVVAGLRQPAHVVHVVGRLPQAHPDRAGVDGPVAVADRGGRREGRQDRQGDGDHAAPQKGSTLQPPHGVLHWTAALKAIGQTVPALQRRVPDGSPYSRRGRASWTSHACASVISPFCRSPSVRLGTVSHGSTTLGRVGSSM